MGQARGGVKGERCNEESGSEKMDGCATTVCPKQRRKALSWNREKETAKIS